MLEPICVGDPMALSCRGTMLVLWPLNTDPSTLRRSRSAKTPSRRARTDPHQREPPIERLLFIADSAVAETDDLPPSVRAIIDEAAELYVLPPTLPGRLAWLADDIDRFRSVADERLAVVLGHMRSIGATPAERRVEAAC